MLGFVALCLLAGLLPGFVIDAIAPAAELLVGARLPVQADAPWLSIVPVAEARSSYNGLLVFAFIAFSASLRGGADPSLRVTRAAPLARRGTADFPTPARSTQYTGGSVAQPIRRVFGSLLFLAREQVEMPPPGDTGAGALPASSCAT